MKKYTRFFVYIKPVFPFIVAGIILGLIFGLSSGLGMPLIFDKVFRVIFENVGTQKEYSLMEVAGIAMLLPLVFLVRAISGYLSGLFMTRAALEALRAIKQDLFAKVQTYPLAFFDKHTTGDLMVRLSSDTQSIQGILLSFASEMFRQPFQVVGALSFLIVLSLKHGEVGFLFFFLAAVPFCILPVQIIRKRFKTYARKTQGYLGEISQVFSENLDASHEVRVFSLQDKENEKFADKNLGFQRFSFKLACYELLQQPFMEFIAALMVSSTFIYAYKAKIDFTTFSTIGLALYFTIDPIKRIMRLISDLIKATPLFERLNEVLDYKSSVPEAVNPVKIDHLQGKIVFDKVSFAYNDKVVLKNTNITIPAGTSCALVGESGAGKSTFAKLVMRLYDPVSGEVSVDGISLKNIATKDYMANLGSVPQYPVLFNDTIFNNIKLAKLDATDEEIYTASKAAFAHDFICELEDGYNTMAGERGDRLSGGQKQRIAIARVFLKNPPLIVLDEATSALDANSEAFIQKALDNMMKDRTVFIIAHRFSTIRNVQKIIVFKEGEIIDFGTHQELMERCPYFVELYERQMSRVEA